MEQPVPNIACLSLRYSRSRLAAQACVLVAGYAAIFSLYYLDHTDDLGRTVGLWLFGGMGLASAPSCILESFRRFESLPTGLRIKGAFTARTFPWENIERVELGSPIWTLLFVRGKFRPVGIFRFLCAPADLRQFDALLSGRVSAERHVVISFIDSLCWPFRAARTLRTSHLERKVGPVDGSA